MKASDVLRQAKALIDSPEKWTKDFFSRGGALCAVAAIDTVHPLFCEADTDVYGLFARANEISSISRWNDAPERTHAEVMAAFDRAIALALEREATGV